MIVGPAESSERLSTGACPRQRAVLLTQQAAVVPGTVPPVRRHGDGPRCQSRHCINDVAAVNWSGVTGY